MNKKAKSATKEIVIGVLILVIAGLILGGGSIEGLFGIFNSADPVKVVPPNNNEEVCPSTLSFNSNDEGGFSVALMNGGDEDVMFVELVSQEILSRSKNGESFTNVSSESWRVQSDVFQDYGFDIKRIDSKAKNITIIVGYGCEGILCQKKTFCCKYAQQQEIDYRYSFVEESCF